MKFIYSTLTSLLIFFGSLSNIIYNKINFIIIFSYQFFSIIFLNIFLKYALYDFIVGEHLFFSAKFIIFFYSKD